MRGISGIRAVTFDVGGTLIDPWPSVGHVYAEVAAQHGLRDLEPETLTRRFAEAWRAKSDFDYSRAAWSEIVARTFRTPGQPLTEVSFFGDLYERFAQPGGWRIYDDVLPALHQLRARNIRLGVVSNWDERLRPLLGKLKLQDLFEVIVVSGEVGLHKPHPAVFRSALEQLGWPGHAVLHVGDRVIEDVQGAEQAGLRAVRLNRHAIISDEKEIHSLLSLTEFIR
ncbi:MAG: HAD-IA family hydrolase [Verrucomicrobia bacterium]|nr:HAD-IA family hydrolase [Verrucomicrobiota bacterium]